MKGIKEHVLFWVCYFCMTISMYYIKEPILGLHVLYELAVLPTKLILTYFVLYFLLPRFLEKKDFIVSSFYLLLSFSLSILAIHISVSLVVYPVYFPDVSLSFFPNDWGKFISPMLEILVVTSIATIITLIRKRDDDRRSLLELEKANTQNELNFLRSQIHPHFLFNSLNGIYALTLSNPSLASEMVLGLSNILRYILYKSNEHYVNLEEDIQCVKGYIELEKIRYRGKLDVDFEFPSNLQGEKIVPLLILPFVENAFKHGPSKDYSLTFIKGKIEIKGGSLFFSLRNSVGKFRELDCKDVKGIGILNTKKRLAYYFKDKYSLKTKNTGEEYQIDLVIPLKYD